MGWVLPLGFDTSTNLTLSPTQTYYSFSGCGTVSTASITDSGQMCSFIFVNAPITESTESINWRVICFCEEIRSIEMQLRYEPSVSTALQSYLWTSGGIINSECVSCDTIFYSSLLSPGSIVCHCLFLVFRRPQVVTEIFKYSSSMCFSSHNWIDLWESDGNKTWDKDMWLPAGVRW